MARLELIEAFSENWGTYFPGAELPLVFFYTDDDSVAEYLRGSEGWRCVIGDLAQVRKGKSLLFDINSVSCGGGKRYFGFTSESSPDLDYFLSCGLPGRIKGERFKKSPEIVRQSMKNQPPFAAPAKYIVFKRWDALKANDNPEAAIFFATPDVLAGLFTLAGFDDPDPHGVSAPFCSGCSAIVYQPYHENKKNKPRAILGMFDISARPYVQANLLTFAVSWNKFVRMANNMDKSFLTTESWRKIKNRIKRQNSKSEQ
jgi:hypothetical protein